MADDYEPLAPRLYEIYLDELAKLGKPAPEPDSRRGQAGPMALFVSEDPDRDWARIAPHALHETNSYGAWASGMKGSVYAQFDDADELRRSGRYLVLTPDECVDFAKDRTDISFKPLMGGVDPAIGWRTLELFVERVLPRL
jgi:hypothetical protein